MLCMLIKNKKYTATIGYAYLHRKASTLKESEQEPPSSTHSNTKLGFTLDLLGLLYFALISRIYSSLEMGWLF